MRDTIRCMSIFDNPVEVVTVISRSLLRGLRVVAGQQGAPLVWLDPRVL